MSEEATVQVQLLDKPRKVGKEISEIAEGLKEIILDVRAGKKMEVVSENLMNVMTMIQGWEMLDDEAKHASNIKSFAYLAECLGEAFTQDVVKVTE